MYLLISWNYATQSLTIETGSVAASDVNCVCRPVFPLHYIVAACVRISLSILAYVSNVRNLLSI